MRPREDARRTLIAPRGDHEKAGPLSMWGVVQYAPVLMISPPFLVCNL